MTQTSEPFVQFGRSNFEAALIVADITLQSTERLVDLQMRTAKEALEQGLRNVKALSTVRNMQEFIALQSTASQPSLEKALAYSRDVYAVTTDAQARISKVLKTRIDALGGEIMTAVDHAAKSRPGSEATIAAITSALAAGPNAHAAMTQPASRSRRVVAVKRTPGKRGAAKRKGR